MWLNVVKGGLMWLKAFFVVKSGFMWCYVVEIGLMWLKVVFMWLISGVMWLKVHCCLCLSMRFLETLV